MRHPLRLRIDAVISACVGIPEPAVVDEWTGFVLGWWIQFAYNSNAMARPTKLTPKVRRRVLEAAADGLTLQDCAALVGVSRETLRNWTRIDEEFAWAFRRARAEARQEVLQLLKRGGGGGHWRARLAWLARTTTRLPGGTRPVRRGPAAGEIRTR